MELLEEFEEATMGKGSRIDQIVNGFALPSEGSEGLSESERKELHAHVTNTKFGTAAIAKVLRRRGYEIGESSVRRYRQKHDTR